VTGKQSVDELITALRQAGLDAWDDVEDPEQLLADIRGIDKSDLCDQD
jgi:hypothetical protein